MIQKDSNMKNPLLSPGKVPAFDKIKVSDYMPAIDKAIDDVRRQLKKITGCRQPASFGNTVVPLESLFNDINYVCSIFRSQASNVSGPALVEALGSVNVKVANFTKSVFQDRALSKRFLAVYKQRQKLKLGEDDAAILRNLHKTFEMSGAFLSAGGQKYIRAIDARLISLSQKFVKNLMAAPLEEAVLITDKTELAGLSPLEIARLESNARENGHKKGWLFIPERLLIDEMLETAESSVFRKKICDSLLRTGKQKPHDNRPIIAEMQKLRHEYAVLLGYKNYAAFARSRQMVKDLSAVQKFLDELTRKALPQFKKDMKSLEKFAVANGGPKKLQPWDVSYWTGRQRKALYGFDGTAFAKNLQMDNVLKGMFDQATRIFGQQFRENTGKYPVLHPDIRTFDVIDQKTGKLTGILHIDLYARPGQKFGGAWMDQLQLKTKDRPNVIIFNMNLAKPPKGKQALIAPFQYEITYHEFGHALHGLLGVNVKYSSLMGIVAPTDFIEIHSMSNEHRATVNDNLQKYALHVDTNLPPDEKTLTALAGARSFFQSRQILRLVQNSLRDLAFHTMDPAKYKGDDALEKAVRLKTIYAEHLRPYGLARFDHLFNAAHSRYAVGFVNYLIAQAHAADAFVPFKENPYSAEWAKRLKAFYSRGSGGEPAELYKQYRGRAANTEAMLVDAGIGAKKTRK
jgi:peptidyl-dipeptidase Dcp